MNDTIQYAIQNPTTSNRPQFGYKLGKRYTASFPRAWFVRPSQIAPQAGYQLVSIASTDTYATHGYSKDSYVALAHERAVEEWTAAGYQVIERKRVDYRSWIGHDWYGRGFHDYSYHNEVWVKADGPFSVILGLTRNAIENLIWDARWKELTGKR